MMVKRVSSECIKLWSTIICIGDRVKVEARTLESSEWIDGVVRELRYTYMTVESDDGVHVVRYPMVVKVVKYER